MKSLLKAGAAMLFGIVLSLLLLLFFDQVILAWLPLPPILRGFGQLKTSHPSPQHFHAIELSPQRGSQELSARALQKELIPLSNMVWSRFYDPDTEERLEETNWMYMDPDLGRTTRPQGIARHQLRQSNHFIFNVQYKADQYGRRITPTSPEKRSAKNFIALFGCSMTYGHGLPENETLPYYLGERLADFYPYNYAVGGTGTSYTLAMLQRRNLQQEIPQKKGIGIYLYIDDHLGRSVGDSNWSSIAPNTPNFSLSDRGELKRDGNLQSGHPVRYFFYKIFHGSNLYKKLGLVWPPYIPKKDISLVCAMMERMKQEFMQKFPTSAFYVGFLPASNRDFDSLSSCLAQKKIEFLDLRNALEGYQGSLYLPVDFHPTARANQATAAAIIELLQANKSL